jgi:hypothetical protein
VVDALSAITRSRETDTDGTVLVYDVGSAVCVTLRGEVQRRGRAGSL